MHTPLALEIPHYGRWPVTSYEEASAIYGGVRRRTGLGASLFPDGSITGDTVPIARISYNGRVWPARQWVPGDKPICEASPAADLLVAMAMDS